VIVLQQIYLKTIFSLLEMHYLDKREGIVEPKKDLTERIVFLKLFLPRNFNRVTPVAYVFLIPFFALIIGLMFFKFLWFLIVLGGFMMFIFAIYAVFWKYSILDVLVKL
jgi:hypothetical protein